MRWLSNLTSVILQSGPNFAISHDTTSPEVHTHAEKTTSLVNTYLTDKLHTHFTLQAKPDLSLIKSTVTKKKRHLHDTMQPLLQTKVKPNDDSKTRDLCRSGWRQNYYLTIDRITIFANYLSCYVSLNQALFCYSSVNLKISRLKWPRFETLRSPITEKMF